MEKVRKKARRPAVWRGRWVVDDFQMGRAGLVFLGRSLHDRVGGVSVPRMPAIRLRRGPLGRLCAVAADRVGHGGYARFLAHARERLGRDGRIVAAVGGESAVRRSVRRAGGLGSGWGWG